MGTQEKPIKDDQWEFPSLVMVNITRENCVVTSQSETSAFHSKPIVLGNRKIRRKDPEHKLTVSTNNREGFSGMGILDI